MKLSRERARQAYLDNIDRLISINPDVFNKKFPLPLKVGIYHEVKELLELPCRETNALLSGWCSRWEYGAMMASGHMRRDTNGQITSFGDYLDKRREAVIRKRLGTKKYKAFNEEHKVAFGFDAFSLIK